MKNNEQLPYFALQVFADIKKIKTIIKISLFITAVCLACYLWAFINYDEYSYSYKIKISLKGRAGQMTDGGLAPMMLGWSAVIGVLSLLVALGVWKFTDFKNPVMAVSREGLFMNRMWFKETFIKWSEFESMEIKKATQNLDLIVKNPQEILDRQPKGFSKTMLVQMLTKMGTPKITLDSKELKSKSPNFIDFILRKSGVELIQ